MEQITMVKDGRPGGVSDRGGLPLHQAEWPQGARQAFHEVLRELDGWCREHGRPRSMNAGIAEQAIRQVW
jgi:hypothetical protein